MNTNMFNEYYSYKLKTVYQYSILLSKILGVDKNKLWHRRRDLDNSIEYIVDDFFKRMTDYDKVQYKSLVRCFISDKEIFKYNIDRELYSVINYFIENKRAFEITAYEKEIVLAAIILNIANNIDISTSPYKVNKNNYKTIVLSYLEKFNKIEYIHLIDDGKKNTKVLLELIKTNVRKERRIFELLSSNVSFNKYIDISLENIYYLTSYNYSVPGLNKLDKAAGSYIYNHDDIDDKFALMSTDLIVVTLMKLFSVRKFNKMFFLPLKREFVLNESNLKVLSNLLKNDYLDKRIKILYNFDDLSEKSNNLFGKYHLDYYIYCSKNTKFGSIDDEFKTKDYLVSNDFYLNNKRFVDGLLEDGVNVIIEKFDGIVTDKKLVLES